MARPVLKWPGGKRWLASRIARHLADAGDRYIEPFLGGGAMLFALEPARAVAADVNEELIACYEVLKSNAAGVIVALKKLRKSKKTYLWARDEWRPRKKVDRAARLIYLLRHSWNGLYRVNQAGRFNVPYRSRRLKSRRTGTVLLATQRLLKGVDLRCQDFARTLSQARAQDLIFIDPPYFSADGEMFKRYTPTYFGETQQKRLARALRRAERRGAAWILTNGSLDQLAKHFYKYDCFRAVRPSTIAGKSKARGRVEEYIVLSRSRRLDRLRRNLRRADSGFKVVRIAHDSNG